METWEEVVVLDATKATMTTTESMLTSDLLLRQTVRRY